MTAPKAPDAPQTPAEFSRIVATDALHPDDVVTGEAKEGERAALATRYSVPAVRALKFRATARPWGPGGWRVDGVVDAALTQTCVLTLEPVDTTLSEPFRRYYAPARRMGETEGLLPEDEAPDPLGAGIDFGEAAAEAAALAIDPYPRRPDAAFDGVLVAPPGGAPLTDEAVRPFARLAVLKGEGSDG
jgi:hypothetical protein